MTLSSQNAINASSSLLGIVARTSAKYDQITGFSAKLKARRESFPQESVSASVIQVTAQIDAALANPVTQGDVITASLLKAFIVGVNDMVTSSNVKLTAMNTTIGVIGDSLTLRTGLCPIGTSIPVTGPCATPETSYATYLDNVIINAGRGGDTCAAGPVFVGTPFIGSPRGLEARLFEVTDLSPTLVSVLIGINDVNAFTLGNVVETANRIAVIWQKIRAAGCEPIAMTYPIIPGLTLESELNAQIRLRASENGVRLVDVETLGSLPTTDGIHPTAGSAIQIANLWKAIIFG